MTNTYKKVISMALLSAGMLPATLSADDWEFGAAIYGWFPDISGQTAFTPPGGGGDFTVEIGDILENLQFTFQGSFDARKGQWGLFTDVIYMDLGKTQSNFNDGTVGGTNLPYDVTGSVTFDMKSWIWTTAGYYRMVDDQGTSFDVLAGVRYADVDQELGWNLSGDIGQLPLPGPVGNASVGGTNWDFIVGLRGKLGLGQGGSWFLPYYADVGTGDSDVTWQAVAGIGYAFGWGEVAGVYRYLSYDQSKDRPLADMNFSGPALGVVFRW